MSDTEDITQDTGEEGQDETLQTFEEQKKRKEAQLEDEMEEYKAVRAAEKEKEANEIEELKKRKKERAIQRAEEEKRMSEQRKEEEARRKVEEEERKKKKAEDEERRRKEKERRRLEAEKRKGPKTPNFTIVKKEGGDDGKEETEKKSPQKTKEELEREKKAALASRVQPLGDTDNMNTDQLVELARDLHEQIRNIVTNMYNNDERYKRQQYDIVELQERARAQSKTKKKGVSSVQYDDSYDRMNDRFSNAPPKILVANKYEANLDRRPWNDRLNQFGKEDLCDIQKIYNDYIDSNYLTGGF